MSQTISSPLPPILLTTIPVPPISVIVVSLLFFCYAAYQSLWHPLAALPTLHWSTSLSRVHYIYNICFFSRREMHLSAHLNSEGFEGFQPLVRTGPNEVSVMSTEGIKTAFDGGFERSTWYHAFVKYGKHIMFTFQSSKAHTARRRLYAKDYSKSNISGSHVQSIIHNKVSQLQSFLTHHTTNTQNIPLVVRNIFRALQIDTVTAFAFSTEDGTNHLGKLSSKSHNTVDDLALDPLESFYDERNQDFFFWEVEAPFRYFRQFFAQKGIEAQKKSESWMNQMIARFENRLHSCKSPAEQRKLVATSVYGKMCQSQSLHKDEMAGEILDHVGAGQENLPSVMEYIVRQLSRYPEMQRRLREELASLPPTTDSETCSYKALDNAPYLNAIIYESMRLIDVIESYQPRVVPQGGCILHGHFLPEGTVVSAQPYLIHRQQDVFPQPEVFRPERWMLEGGALRALKKNLFVFSSGPRACVGKELALATIRITVAEIYRGFETELGREEGRPRRSWEGRYPFAEVVFRSLNG